MNDKSDRVQGGCVFTPDDMPASEYLPNRGVFLTGMLGKGRGDAIGLYRGRMGPGCQIQREVHPETAETVYILAGEAVGLLGDREIPLRAGQVLHAERGTPHGVRNAGRGDLHFLVIGSPDF